jgi:phosphoglycolate phosphatase
VSGPRLVVFDLDGTLVDSSGDLASAVNAALAAVAPGTPPLPTARVRALVGSGARNLVARSLEAAGLPQAVDDVLPVFLDRYRSRLLAETRPYPGVLEALERLGDRALAVLSNKPGDMSREILAGLGLLPRFFRVYGGDDVPVKKPDPAGLLLLLREARVAPSEGIVVGDSAIDVRTARAAGAWSVGVSYGFDPASFAAHPPDLLIDDLRALPERLSHQWPA